MNSTVELPILRELIQGGIAHGSNILVEFEPDSLWYETSFTIAADAIKSGRRVEYHTFVRTAEEVKELLAKLASNVQELQKSGVLEIIDSYAAQIGLDVPQESSGSSGIRYSRSLKLADMSITLAKSMKAGEVSKGTLHIDDNASVFLQYNDEKTFVDVWRTRNLPQTRVDEAVCLYALVAGMGSPALYKQLESLSDGIVDFKSPETGGQVEHLMRLRTMRGKSYDSRWRRLQLMENGAVSLAD